MIVSKALTLRKSAGQTIRGSPGDGSSSLLTVDNPAGWLHGEDAELLGTTEALKLSAVYGAVDYVCNFISALPVYVYDRDKRVRVPTHPLMQVLALRPNEAQTPADYKRMMTRHLELRGNAYAYICRSPETGRPTELLPLLPDYMQIGSVNGELAYFYTHPKTGTLYRLFPSDVLHYKGNSSDGYRGESVLKYAARTLRVARAAAQYEESVYRHGAHPSGVLETTANLSGPSETPDPENPGRVLSKKENVRRAWENVHGGAVNAFRTAVLDNGLSYKPITVSSFDASFIAARDVTVADIARFFGVPMHALMAGKQSYQSNEQNAMEFVQGKGMAMIRNMEEEDSYKLLLGADLGRNLWIKRNFEARLRGDSASRAAFYKSLWDMGVLSPNDINRLEDRPDVPGGDVRMARLDSVPLENFREISLANARNKAVENEMI